MKSGKAFKPWLPADWDPYDVAAFQALARGVANEGQQKRALDYIIKSLCGTYESTFVPGPGGERDSSFAQGKRWVGLQIVKLVNMPAHLIKKAKEGTNG